MAATWVDYLFADGHVKSLRPMSTVSGAMGGGAVNIWTRDASDYGSESDDNMAKYRAVLGNAAAKYR